MDPGREAGQRKGAVGRGDGKNLATIPITDNKDRGHSLGASYASIFNIFICVFVFPNVAIHLFDPFDPAVFPPLWVTDMQGEMCVCCCVQAGCYCHQEQSHLLPTTRYAADRTGKSPERRLLLSTHSHMKHKNIINTRVVLRDPTDEKNPQIC